MYYPYFRGKQFELILIRECAQFISENSIIPIIEPVKANLSSLEKCIVELQGKNASPILVLNPKVGELANKSPMSLYNFVDKITNDQCHLGYIVDANTDIEKLESFLGKYKKKSISIIHRGYDKGKVLAQVTNGYENVKTHVFIDGSSSKMYQAHFKKSGLSRILIRNGFKCQKNANYPDYEHFSDLHATYRDEGMNGFGDFLIVGDEYSEAGGPAYAVAIHITYIDSENDMFVYHFKSDRTDSPTDPAGKFMEALVKLVRELKRPSTDILHTSACEEFMKLNKKGHFPGLGYIKKLSLQHHLEVVANFIYSN